MLSDTSSASSTPQSSEAPTASPSPRDAFGEEDLVWLARILDVVRERKGLDFSGYRRTTLLRRVQNRMIAASVRTPSEYFDRLHARPEETDALVERLTIKVSRFFRHRVAFDALAQALARRHAERSPAPLEVWSAGCGQGEEPYSLAMLLDSQGLAAGAPPILATDIDSGALAFAERGQYPLAAMAELDPPLRERYFDELPVARGAAYLVRPPLRAGVELRVHDLAGSPSAPGGRRFDLICCRNVLIYLQQQLQLKVEMLLADSLRPRGLLCLGEAEWLLPEVAGRFEVIDRKARLFRLRNAPIPQETP